MNHQFLRTTGGTSKVAKPLVVDINSIVEKQVFDNFINHEEIIMLLHKLWDLFNYNDKELIRIVLKIVNRLLQKKKTRVANTMT